MGGGGGEGWDRQGRMEGDRKAGVSGEVRCDIDVVSAHRLCEEGCHEKRTGCAGMVGQKIEGDEGRTRGRPRGMRRVWREADSIRLEY